MFLLTFQLAILALVFLSFLMVISVPVVFASPNGWSENKNYILIGSAAWAGLVLLIGALNSFVA